MRKLVVAALAATVLGGVVGAADAAPGVVFGVEAVGAPAPVVQTQYFYGGRHFAWYAGGWRGPGFYWPGYAWRRGYGWGGPAGWRGWYAPGWRGPGWRGPGWRGGYYRRPWGRRYY